MLVFSKQNLIGRRFKAKGKQAGWAPICFSCLATPLGQVMVCKCVCSEVGGGCKVGCKLFSHPLRYVCVSVSVSPGQPAPSEPAYLIDQPHVCLTVPLGAIWCSSLICPLSLPIHSVFLSFCSIPAASALSISSSSCPLLPLLVPPAT